MRDRGSAVHIFSAAVSQASVVGSELSALADRLGDGSIAPLIMHLVEEKRLTTQEAAEIRSILDNYAKQPEPTDE